jgi:hypothetical protein
MEIRSKAESGLTSGKFLRCRALVLFIVSPVLDLRLHACSVFILRIRVQTSHYNLSGPIIGIETQRHTQLRPVVGRKSLHGRQSYTIQGRLPDVNDLRFLPVHHCVNVDVDLPIGRMKCFLDDDI